MKKIIFSGIIATLVFCALFCSDDTVPIIRKTFVLVHGAWQASWVWQDDKSCRYPKGISNPKRALPVPNYARFYFKNSINNRSIV